MRIREWFIASEEIGTRLWNQKIDSPGSWPGYWRAGLQPGRNVTT